MNSKITNVERIIAKIDNDFNLDNTDWIPRVPAWIIDCMMQLNILRTNTVKKKYPVVNGFVKAGCNLFNKDFKVFDINGCEIKEGSQEKGCSSCHSSTGEQKNTGTTEIVNTGFKDVPNAHVIHNNSFDVREQHLNVPISSSPVGNGNHKYYKVSSDIIELTFESGTVIIQTEEVETYYSEAFKTELPVIPNNGILIECLGFYCMYKMLCRGYKHPVFNLSASQYGTNPYYTYLQLKDKAKVSVINNSQNYDGDEWRNYFYNFTFPK